MPDEAYTLALTSEQQQTYEVAVAGSSPRAIRAIINTLANEAAGTRRDEHLASLTEEQHRDRDGSFDLKVERARKDLEAQLREQVPKQAWDRPEAFAVKDGFITREAVADWTGEKEWLAVIKRDPKGPNGLGRTFAERGNGPYAHSTSGLKAGQAIELASYGLDRKKRRRKERRLWGVIEAVSDQVVLVREYSDSDSAIAATKELAQIDLTAEERALADALRALPAERRGAVLAAVADPSPLSAGYATRVR